MFFHSEASLDEQIGLIAGISAGLEDDFNYVFLNWLKDRLGIENYPFAWPEIVRRHDSSELTQDHFLKLVRSFLEDSPIARK